MARLTIAAFLACFVAGCDEGANNSKASVKQIEIDKEFFPFLNKISQDESQGPKYKEILEKLGKVVAEEAKKNPAEMSEYLESLLPYIPSAGPAVALQMEEYANAEVQNKMKQIQLEEFKLEAKVAEGEKTVKELAENIKELESLNERAIEKLAKLEADNALAEGKRANLQADNSERQKIIDGQLAKIGGLEKEAQGLREEIKKLQKERSDVKLREQEKEKLVAGLEEEIANLKKSNVDLQSKNDELGKKISTSQREAFNGKTVMIGKESESSLRERFRKFDGSDTDLVEIFRMAKFNLNDDDLWDGVKKWPEAFFKKTFSISVRYRANEVKSGFRRITINNKELLIEFEANDKELDFLPSQEEPKNWDNKKPIKYSKIRISRPGKPKIYLLVAQLNDDGTDYIKGWALEDDLLIIKTGGG